MMVTPSMIAVLLSLELVGQAPATATPVPGDWVVVESKEGMFRFAMPMRPKEERREEPTPVGNMKVALSIYQGADAMLMMYHGIAPGEFAMEELAGGFEKGFLKKVGGTVQVVSRKPITIDGVPGRDLSMTVDVPQRGGKGTIRAIILARGVHIYAALAMSRPGNPLPPAAKTFFDSIRLDGNPAAPPLLSRMAAGAATPAKAAPPARTAPALPPKRNPIGKIDRVDTTSEAAFRTFLMAMEAGDEETLRSVTLAHADFDWLLRGEPTRAAGIAELKQRMIKARVLRLKEGDKVKLAGGKVHVVAAAEVGRDRAALRMEGTPAYAPLQRVKGHWKVDPAPVIADRKADWAASRKRP